MISAILLAAGQSRRMNGENKLIKNIRGIPLIKYSVQNILDSDINELIIVLGYQKEIVQKIIGKNEKIKFVSNENFETGMASSIKIGIKNLSKETSAFFICLGDMPLINKKIYNSLILAKTNKEIVIPTYKGKQANPVLFSISMKEKIMSIEGDVGAKNILNVKNNDILNLEILDKSSIKDFNTNDNFNF